MRLLIIEDEPGIAGFLKDGLEEEYFAVDIAYDGKSGLDMALINEYDLLYRRRPHLHEPCGRREVCSQARSQQSPARDF